MNFSQKIKLEKLCWLEHDVSVLGTCFRQFGKRWTPTPGLPSPQRFKKPSTKRAWNNHGFRPANLTANRRCHSLTVNPLPPRIIKRSERWGGKRCWRRTLNHQNRLLMRFLMNNWLKIISNFLEANLFGRFNAKSLSVSRSSTTLSSPSRASVESRWVENWLKAFIQQW